MKHAIIAIEDRRFYTNEGVDLRGIGRALYQDVVQKKVVQGGSTITQQFVKNALAAQDDRTLFQKLREAALAYHLTRKWSKEKILRNYLNTIYFGNGAYGIEAAARTYFQPNHPGCDVTRRQALRRPTCQPARGGAARRAWSRHPSGYDPIAHPEAARARRNLVLAAHARAGLPHARAVRRRARRSRCPTQGDLQPPDEDTRVPVLHLLDQAAGRRPARRRPGGRAAGVRGRPAGQDDDRRRAPAGRRRTRSTSWLPEPRRPARGARGDREHDRQGPRDGRRRRLQRRSRSTSPRRASASPARRSSRSSSPRRCSQGISPNSVVGVARSSTIDVPHSQGDLHGQQLRGRLLRACTTLARATTFSDNSVFAQVGIKVGTRKVARLAERMGIRTHVSHNYAMTLGGLKQGVTPLDMAHAYETFASGGELDLRHAQPGRRQPRATSTAPGPVGIERDHAPATTAMDGRSSCPSGERAVNHRAHAQRARPRASPTQVGSLLQGVVRVGTGTRAQVGDTVDRRQDRHDRGLRRRLVRRLDAEVHGRGLGRLPERVQVDGDRVPGPAGGRRHLPGRDLPDVHRGATCGTTRRRRRRRRGPGRAGAGTPAAGAPAPTAVAGRRHRRPSAPTPAPTTDPAPTADASPAPTPAPTTARRAGGGRAAARRRRPAPTPAAPRAR